MKILALFALLLLPSAPAFAQLPVQADWTTTKTADLSQLDQVRYAQLTVAEKTALQTVTASAIGKCATNANDAADTFQRLRARRTDLGNGPGFILEGTGCLCDSGNCHFWIVSSDMQTLFEGSAQTYALLPSITAGHFDLVTAAHVSMTNSTRALYAFDGTKYQPTQCADVNLTNAFGNMQMKPTITMQKCQ